MTPAAAIAALDRQIAVHGQHVTLQRIVANGPPVAIPIRAFVRGYAIEELVGGIVQGDRQVILSPTGLTGPFAVDAPRRNDSVWIEGREHNIEAPDPVRVASRLVRINLQVRG